MLLSFIKWLVKNDLAEPIILINRKGELDDEFRLLGSTWFFYQGKSSIGRGIIFKLYCRFHNSAFGKKNYLTRLKKKLQSAAPNLIYSNTIGNGEILEFCSFLDLKTVTHVHERKYVIDLLGIENWQLVKKYTTHYVACSDFVRLDLQSKSVPPSITSLIYPSVDTKIVRQTSALAGQRIDLARKNGYSIIGGSGGFGWIKGTDMIVPLMKELMKLKKKILFVWTGGDLNSPDFQQLQIGIEKEALKDNIYFTGPVTNAIEYFSVFEILVLLSRTESFSIVCLENALLGNPFLTFRDCAGVQVLLENRFDENIIPHFDIPAMAKRIIQLLDDKELRNNIGSALKKIVVEKYSNDICFPQLAELMQQNS